MGRKVSSSPRTSDAAPLTAPSKLTPPKLREVGLIEGPGLNGRGNPLEPFPPATLRQAPPPAWWLKQEEERYAALFPGQVPDAVDPFSYYIHRDRGKPTWGGRLSLSLAGGLVVVAADYLIFQAFGRQFPIFAFLLIIPFYLLLRVSRFLVNIQRARASGLLQALVLANYHYHILVVLRSIRRHSYAGYTAILWGGLLLGLVYFAATQGIRFTPFLGGGILSSGLGGVLLAAFMFRIFSSNEMEAEPFLNVLEHDRFSLGLAYYLSHLLRRIPHLLAAVFALAIPLVVFGAFIILPLAGWLLVDRLFEGYFPAGSIYFSLGLLLVVVLPVGDKVRRILTERIKRSVMAEDIGEWP